MVPAVDALAGVVGVIATGTRTDEGLVLVNGPADFVQGPRARALFGDWPGVEIVYKERGRFGSIAPIASALGRFRGRWVYCIDLGIPGALLARVRHRVGWPSPIRLYYELGDPARPLLANQGRSRLEVDVAHGLDCRLPRHADGLIFRGWYLADYFRCLVPDRRFPPPLWLPDGVDTEVFRPRRDDPDVRALRRRHDLDNAFVVGFVGSLYASPAVDFFPGWELVEALARVPVGGEKPIVGVVVGDGPGRAALESLRDRLNLNGRLKLIGRVPHAEVPLWLNIFDVALSTQTDDPIGWGRTTAKLPEYLSSGTPVICSDVGEAHRCLGDSGQTLPYQGMRDQAYPARLADRLQAMRASDLEPLRDHNRKLALERFDYGRLRLGLRDYLGRDGFIHG